jgi:hypothetical protein
MSTRGSTDAETAWSQRRLERQTSRAQVSKRLHD